MKEVSESVSERINNFCKRFAIIVKPKDIEQIGEYGLINPGNKNIGKLLDKLVRKNKEEQRQRGIPETNIEDLETYADKRGAAETLGLVSDYARGTITVPNYLAAVEVLQALTARLGGEITIHDRKDYKAFHHHAKIDEIPVETQIDTLRGREWKDATDASYHHWVNPLADDPEGTLANPEYQAEMTAIHNMSGVIYDDTDFAVAAVKVQALATQANQPITPMKLSEFGLVTGKSYAVQNKLIKILRETLTNLVKTQEQHVTTTTDINMADPTMPDITPTTEQH